MAKYRILETSYINERIYQPGEEIEFSGDHSPGFHLDPIDDAAKRAVADQKRRDEKAKNERLSPNDARFFPAMMAHNLEGDARGIGVPAQARSGPNAPDTRENQQAREERRDEPQNENRG